MLYEESIWFKNIINKELKDNSVVLNIGSSTKQFIEVDQPYIKSNLFDTLALKNCSVKNVDIKMAEGVNFVGDVTDKEFIKKLKSLNASAIICSNLLEHLTDRKSFCDALVSIMNPHTLLIISVPYSFPYHEDPIDTLYRPSLNELQSDFSSLKMKEGEIVDCGSYFYFANNHLSLLIQAIYLIKIVGLCLVTFFTNKEKFNQLSWFFKRISATCAVFKSN
jgi:hypothetical protein